MFYNVTIMLHTKSTFGIFAISTMRRPLGLLCLLLLFTRTYSDVSHRAAFQNELDSILATARSSRTPTDDADTDLGEGTQHWQYTQKQANQVHCGAQVKISTMSPKHLKVGPGTGTLIWACCEWFKSTER